MVSSSSSAPSLSYADRAKLGKSSSSSHSSTHSPTSSSTSTTDVEKQMDDPLDTALVNGRLTSPPSNPTPNFWAVRREQMAARSAPGAPSSSSSPTLAASPSLPAAPLPSTRAANGVDLADASSWPQVAAATTPVKDKSSARDPTTPTPTPKKSEKTKWVPIPLTELQAAADAVTRGRSSPKATSAATSTHSSPKISSRGRRLPNDDAAHDTRRRSRSRLATHAYTHPFNSPSRPSSSFVLPAPAPTPTSTHIEPHHPPLTLQKRPGSPARSGPVAGYRDIDDLKLGEGRLVMFGSIGASASNADVSPPQRGLGLDIGGGTESDGKRHDETWDVLRRVGGGFAIGLAPDELPRTRMGRTKSRSAPPKFALSPRLVEGKPEIVDLTDGAWLRDVFTAGAGDDEHKWEFGTSRHPPDAVASAPLPPLPLPPQQMYAPPLPHPGMYAAPPGAPMSVSAPESVVGDPSEYEVRGYTYGEQYFPAGERERRAGYTRRGRGQGFAGARGGPNGSAGRGFARRGGGLGPGPSQHFAPPPAAYAPAAAYPPPPPPPGPDGYYMGPPYSLPYAPYVPPPIPPYPGPPVMDTPMRTGPAPVPMPVTVTSFPIDPTRWYLLGQLEYYFSVQNLCTDYWLRKQMDNRGWVPISVIASFNRVRHLTFDAGLVADVLALSALVEVQGDKVRLRDRRWVPFVLPDAPASDVPEAGERTGDAEDNEENEEEEVVFVMGQESEERRGATVQWAAGEGAEQGS